MMYMKICAAVLGGMLVASATHGAIPEEVIDNAFFPYKNWQPDTGQMQPGVVVNKDNVDAIAKDFLDPEMYRMVKDGWVEMPVGKLTPIRLNENYVDATRQHYGGVKLGDQPGQLLGYVAGRPFPQEPDINDPRAGEKLAWNFRYAVHFGDSGKIGPFYWKYRDMNTGKVERTIKMEFRAYNWTHRTLTDPLPEVEVNTAELFRTIYMGVDEPYDVKNTQVLIHRYEDDLKRDNAWLYLGFQRRVRRLATGQITDSFLGSDLMIEDFEGYNGRISDMNWKFKEVVNVLVPVYEHNAVPLGDEFAMEDGYKFITFGGKGDCFPQVTWQVRKNYLIEVVPKDSNHPVGKREMYLDAQTFAFTRINIYDRAKKLWKMWFINQSPYDAHLPRHQGIGVPIYDGFGMLDIQAMHCTTGQFRTEIHPPEVVPRVFSPQYLRTIGR